MSYEPEQPELDLTLPPEFDHAPAWARIIAQEQRRDRHHFGGELLRQQRHIREIRSVLGDEPDADGKGGRGLIGDVRKQERTLGEFLSYKSMGIGFVTALTVFGALILLGVTHWIQTLGGK